MTFWSMSYVTFTWDHVTCDTVQAPSSAFVGPSAAVRGFDAGVSHCLDAGCAGRVSENIASCRVNVQ